jgi:hypothetical protein
MSYARNNGVDSDVYVYEHCAGMQYAEYLAKKEMKSK